MQQVETEQQAIAAAQAAAQQDKALGQFVGLHEVTGRQRVCRFCGCYVEDSMRDIHAKRCDITPDGRQVRQA